MNDKEVLKKVIRWLEYDMKEYGDEVRESKILYEYIKRWKNE